LDETLEGRDADEDQHRQQDQRERVESCAQPRGLADERERDQVGGQSGEIDTRSAVALSDHDRTGGLEIEVLCGRERRGRPQTPGGTSAMPAGPNPGGTVDVGGECHMCRSA